MRIMNDSLLDLFGQRITYERGEDLHLTNGVKDVIGFGGVLALPSDQVDLRGRLTRAEVFFH